MKELLIKWLAFWLAAFCLAGCAGSAEKPKYEGTYTVGYGHMYDRIPDSNQYYSEEEQAIIQKELSSWAKSSLLLDQSEADSVLATAMDEAIVSPDDLTLIQEDRLATTSHSITNVQVELHKAVKTKYEDREIGKIDCQIRLLGSRNDQPLSRVYDMVLLIHYGDGQVSIYEIGDLSFKDEVNEDVY